MTDPTGVTGDGSPVAVYLAAGPGDTAEVACAVLPPPATVLELGCGVGRETRPLLACGYEVTGVDDSPEMLAHVTGAEVVEADLFALDLGRRFELVLGGSHFVDDADPARRDALYATCARHVTRDGAVLLERYDPSWVASLDSYSGAQGLVEIDFTVLRRRDDGAVEARLDYHLAGRSWRQEFAFVAVTPDQVDAEARAHGLTVVATHGEDDTWLELRPR